MPAFVLAFLGGLLDLAGPMVGRVLLALGFSFVTYVGTATFENQVIGMATGSLDGLPASFLSVLGLLKVDVSLNIIVSAYAAAALLSAVSPGGLITKLVRV